MFKLKKELNKLIKIYGIGLVIDELDNLDGELEKECGDLYRHKDCNEFCKFCNEK